MSGIHPRRSQPNGLLFILTKSARRRFFVSSKACRSNYSLVTETARCSLLYHPADTALAVSRTAKIGRQTSLEDKANCTII
jgi:hypothetical protein